MERLNKFGITLLKGKCALGKAEISWFGHIFNGKGMCPDPKKIATVKAWPVPQDISGNQKFPADSTILGSIHGIQTERVDVRGYHCPVAQAYE